MSSPFSIATVNCKGSGGTPHENDPDVGKQQKLKPDHIRYELLQRVLEGYDIILLQEISIKDEINRSKVPATHHMCMERSYRSFETGILLKKDSFPDDFESYTKSSYFTDEKRKIEHGHLTFAVAKPKHSKNKILIVSYHGPYKVTDKIKIETAKKVLKLCLEEKRKKRADYVIMGGDFNLSDKEVEENVLPQIEQSKFHVSSCDSRKLRTKKSIDFFVHEDCISVTNPRIKQFPSDVLQKYSLDKNPTDLKRFLDHDPVVAKMTLKEDLDEAGGEAKSEFTELLDFMASSDGYGYRDGRAQRGRARASSSKSDYECVCGRTFDTCILLKTHQGKKGCLPTPNDDEDLRCRCGRTFDTSHGLRTHQGKKSCLPKDDNEDFRCRCGRTFDTSHGLRTHQGKKGCLPNDDSEDFRCRCGRTFDTSHGLRTHQGKKGCLPNDDNEDFRCKCGRTFATSHGLRTHQGKKGCMST